MLLLLLAAFSSSSESSIVMHSTSLVIFATFVGEAVMEASLTSLMSSSENFRLGACDAKEKRDI